MTRSTSLFVDLPSHKQLVKEELEDDSPFDPIVFAREILRGFCLPNDDGGDDDTEDDASTQNSGIGPKTAKDRTIAAPQGGTQRASRPPQSQGEMRQSLAVVPRCGLPSAKSSSVTVDSSIRHRAGDTSDEAEDSDTREGDDDDDDEICDLVVEVVPGTDRSVRVGKGLEIFFCTVAIFALTVTALQNAGVDFRFALRSKTATLIANSPNTQSSLLLWSFESGGTEDEFICLPRL